jgi:hypothetical protein
VAEVTASPYDGPLSDLRDAVENLAVDLAVGSTGRSLTPTRAARLVTP